MQDTAINNTLKNDISLRQFVRPKDFPAIYGFSRSTVFRMIENGTLPEPKRLSARLIGWPKAQLDAILLSK